METYELNFIALTSSELKEIEGGFVIAMLVICFVAGLAIGLMIV
jgi:lactobin A/cerein 7B family class IIb bacteriocin